MTLEELQQEAYRTAVEHGWWEVKHPLPELLMLIVSEAAEALEEYRNNKPLDIYYEVDEVGTQLPKPLGFASELADILIRVGDLAEGYNIDLSTAVRVKMEYNKTRPYKHGGKLA